MKPTSHPETLPAPPVPRRACGDTAFGGPRDNLNNRYVYAVISARARGLSLGVNLNPDKLCNFDCIYCEVKRPAAPLVTELDIETMAAELLRTLTLIESRQFHLSPAYVALPEELLTLRHVALSGDGEPTLSPKFADAMQAVVHVRALNCVPFFKLVLLTNGTGLDRPDVWENLKFFTRKDEIWIKLDVGAQQSFEAINRPAPGVKFEKVISNILLLGRQRPIVIQSLFPSIDGREPSQLEVDEYVQLLKELKISGAQISLVQIHSAARPVAGARCGHLSLKALARIAQAARAETGLMVEVY